MKRVWQKITDTIKFYTDKKFSTIAGTLVYFLLMSLAPFLLWLTLILGNFDLARFLPEGLFGSVKPFINYLTDSAKSASAGAGAILFISALYSSTNFFYHLRRSGEIIYGSKKTQGGVKLRVISAILIIIVILILAVLAAVSFIGRRVMLVFMPEAVCDIVSLIFFTVLAFFSALLLNMFACPYKLKLNEAVPGSLLTTILWVLFLVGFAVYINFVTPGKLYGAIASVIVFLLWSYFMTCCFVIGMIKNGSYMTEKIYKEYI